MRLSASLKAASRPQVEAKDNELVTMASNLRPMASHLIAMVSNLQAMAQP